MVYYNKVLSYIKVRGGIVLEKELRDIVAQNIFYLRTINHLTQYELGEKINYSDKAISKWERAEGVPDVYVLKNMANLFGVTVDYMLTEHLEQDKKIEKKPVNSKGRTLVMNIIFISIISVALLIFVLVALVAKIYVWQVFIYALPAIAIAGVSCSGAWRKTVSLFFFISMLVWTILLTLFFALGTQGTWMLFLLGIPVQVIVFLGFGVKVNVRMNQKDNPILLTAMEKIQKKSKKNDE